MYCLVRRQRATQPARQPVDPSVKKLLPVHVFFVLAISDHLQKGASVCPSWQHSKHCTLARPPWFKKVENDCEPNVLAFWVDVSIAVQQPAVTYCNLPKPATLDTSPSFRCRDRKTYCHLGRNCWLRWLVVVLLAHLLTTIYEYTTLALAEHDTLTWLPTHYTNAGF